MSIEKNNIKFYHILLLSIILSPFLIINSNYVILKRNKEKLNKEARLKFNKILIGRYLESFQENTEKICKRSSEELNDYYLTGALNKLNELGIIPETQEDDGGKNPEYIDALIDLIKGYTDGESEKDLTENVTTYGFHMMGIVIFLAIAILSIPGWIICCSCCCCNCCCCCFCKKPSCKIPFFIATTLLYIVVIAICAFGLIKSNSIFNGLSDLECSILKFCNEAIEGESKVEKPKWVGITGIQKLLTDVETKINSLGSQTIQNLETQDNFITGNRSDFENHLEKNSVSLTSNENNIEIITDNNIDHLYRLDITTKEYYGVFSKSTRSIDPENSMLKAWYTEYSEIAENSKVYIDDAKTNFKTVLEGDNVKKSLETANNSIIDIKQSINSIKESIADGIINYSDYIDDYGKLGFKIYFSILIVIVAMIAILMFLLCFCSGGPCKYCCCFRCGFKIIIHLLWNILALCMIITFLFGFLLSFVGTIGKDMVYVVNYFISDENLSKEKPTLFGSEGSKLKQCFNGNGEILKELGFDTNETESFDKLKNLNEKILAVKQDFTSLLQQNGTYSILINDLNERVNYKNIDFSIILSEIDNTGQIPQNYKLSELIKDVNSNNYVSSSKHKWDFHCQNNHIDENGITCKTLKDENFEIYNNGEVNPDKTKAYEILKKIKSIMNLVKIANDEYENNKNNYNFKKLNEDLKIKYDNFLNSEINTLQIFNETIKELTDIFNDYIGENGSVFDFINCNFIGKNIQIILGNLKHTLGGNIYTVGVCLLVAGCSMALAISFTILFIVIINVAVDEAKKNNK